MANLPTKHIPEKPQTTTASQGASQRMAKHKRTNPATVGKPDMSKVTHLATTRW